MEVGLQESSAWTAASPRISFSHDLSQVDIDEFSAAAEDDRPHRGLDRSLPLEDSFTASSDFDFSVGADVFSHDSSLADDLFSNGKLLPLPIKAAPSSLLPPPSVPPASPGSCRRKRGSLREVMASAEEGSAGGAGRPSPSKSAFWLFRRSGSLNYGVGDGGGLCSFPLLRSRSSGSSSPMQIRSSAKQCRNAAAAADLFRRGCSSNESKTTATRVYYYSVAATNSRRRVHGNAVRISPVLHVPTPTGMGILSFLLCKRGDKNMAKSSAVVCSP